MAAGMLNPLLPRQDGRLEWGNGVVSMLFDIAGDSPVRLCNVVGRGMIPIDGRLSDDGTPVVEKDPRPIVEVLAANTGSQRSPVANYASFPRSRPNRGRVPPIRSVWRSRSSRRMPILSRKAANSSRPPVSAMRLPLLRIPRL